MQAIASASAILLAVLLSGPGAICGRREHDEIVAEVKVANGASRKITCCDPNLPAPVNGSGTCESLNNCSTDAIIAVLERMDAFLSESDEQGHITSYGKVAVAATVGNEDGAHI